MCTHSVYLIPIISLKVDGINLLSQVRKQSEKG